MTSEHPATTFAEVFRAALDASPFTLSQLQERLTDSGNPISLASLSYWRSGARIPDASRQAATLAQLEDLLNLEHGSLSALSSSPRTGPRAVEPPTLRFDPLIEGEDPQVLFEEASRVLRAPSEEQYRDVSLQQITDVGSDGLPEKSSWRAAVQCIEGEMSRLMYFSITAPGTADTERFTVTDGGRIVDRYVSPQRTACAVAIEFERPLRVGETGVVTLQIDYITAPGANRGIGIGVKRPTKMVANWVRFHPDAVPDWVRQIELTGDGESTRTFRGLDTPTSAHTVKSDFGPGGIGIAWGYGEPSEDEG